MKVSKSLFIAAVLTFITVIAVQAAGPTGAIFTTTPNGSIVNENVRYNQKIEVYLDGGPGPNAPISAAGLDAGKYVFQVTDPSGKFLLSMDPAKCRVFEVSTQGVITRLVEPTELGLATNTYGKGTACHIQNSPEGAAGKSGQHDTNIDTDHGLPAIVVQLMPFGDTPNPGGVYKAWAEKLDTYISKGGSLAYEPVALKGAAAKGCPNFCANRDPGFGPANTDTKTDNFKVKIKSNYVPPLINVYKFHDRNFNGVKDAGEEDITGWPISIYDPVANMTEYPLYTPVIYQVGNWPATYQVTEDLLATQTVSTLDGNIVSLYPNANPLVNIPVMGTSGEIHTVVYGNVGTGSVAACKIYDRNGNGQVDLGEPAVPGWKMELTGTLANGAVYGPVDQITGADGCTTFSPLLPGTYTLTEIFPSGNWFSNDGGPYTFTVESTLVNGIPTGGIYSHTFANYCQCYADFDTKGYWHNKNGLAEITQADIDYVNGLPPYKAATYYWQFPFDGTWNAGPDEYFGTGAWAEISDFLPDRVNTAPAEEQLSQQLLAFIFNVRHRLDNPNAMIEYNGQWMSAQSVIDSAIAAWQSPGIDDDHYWEGVLDALNNNDAVPIIPAEPCAVIYP